MKTGEQKKKIKRRKRRIRRIWSGSRKLEKKGKRGMGKKKGSLVNYLKQHYLLYLMLVLPLTFFIIFSYVPMSGLVISFQNYNIKKGIFGSEWVGFDIFKALFKTSKFWRAVRNTITLNVLGLLLGFPMPIIIALLLNEFGDGIIKKVVQSVVILPHFVSWVVVGGIAIQIFATEGGIINSFLGNMGLSKIPFLSEKLPWIFTYQFIGIWKGAGWDSIIYLAAIAGVDQEQYDAARVDGCSRFQMMYKITLPNIMPTVVLLLILRIGGIASIGFDQPYMLGNTMVTSVSEVLSTYTYELGIVQGKLNYATATGFFQSLVNFVLVMTANKVSDKLSGNALW